MALVPQARSFDFRQPSTAPAASPRPQPRPPTSPAAAAASTPNVALPAASGILPSGIRSSFSEFLSGLGAGSSSGLNLQTLDQIRSLGSSFQAGLNLDAIDVRSLQQGLNIPGQGNAADRSTIPVEDSTAGNGSRQPNVLRNFNHYNYIITLGILDRDQFNNPLSYRDENSFSKIILQSGGGGLNTRHRITAEGDADAEYYIENLNIDAVIAPNPNTGVNLGTTIEFEVVEPYSMGKFTEALVTAAEELQFSNFTNAPFCLRIDFKGWDDSNNNITTMEYPYYIPFHFVNVEFSVTHSGSRYQARAIAVNDVATADSVSRIRNEIQATGTLVHDILENGANSVTSGLNQITEDIQNPQGPIPSFIPEFDKYIIVFPTTEDGIVNAVQSRLERPEPLTLQEEQDILQGFGGNPLQNIEGTRRAIEERRAEVTSGIYDTLKAYARTEINEIGMSAINLDVFEGSNQAMIRAAQVFNRDLNVFVRDISEADIGTTSREVVFQQRDRIPQIIESIFIMSEYAEDSLDDSNIDSTLGTRKWFRIDTYVFIEDNAETRSRIGRDAKVYVYAVYPYEIDQDIHASSGASAQGTENLRNQAIKEYNYIYTGQNEDVLDFNIDFNYAFLQAAFADFGNFSGVRATGRRALSEQSDEESIVGFGEGQVDPGLAAAAGIDPSIRRESPRITGFTAGDEGNVPDGSSGDSPQERVLRTFHERLINSHVDMLMAEMTIWGDPYFLPGINGNYVPSRGSSRMVNAEGRMRYLQNEVYIIVNFLTPIDYRQGGSLMDFAELEERFSGLYRVLTVRNIFDSGQYKQEMKLIRRHGQTDDPRGGSVMRTSSTSDRFFDPYSSVSRDTSGRRAQAVGGVPTRLPEFGRLGVGTAVGQLSGAGGQISGAINQLSGAVGQIRGAVGQFQQAQSPQQILQAFSSIMPAQVLNFQSQFGNLREQLAAVRPQIAAAATTPSAAQARAGGAFPAQTPSALAPQTSLIPRARPINSSLAPQTSPRPPSRPDRPTPGGILV